MPNVLIAMDSFKGTLSAPVACRIVADAFRTLRPDIVLSVKPIADDGEGTADVVISACGGEYISQTVIGPLMDMEVAAGFGFLEHNRTAIVEMAKASGLELLRKDQQNPLLTTTYGTGQLIDAVCKKGANQILLAVGGSATVDGGTGAARALGWRFLDGNADEVPHGGGFLTQIETIVPPRSMELPQISVLCDVNNPLCGPTGAAHTYAPQKGADDQMVKQLEEGLAHVARLIHRDIGTDVRDMPGAGAAGGLAAGAVAFMNGTLTSGLYKVMDCLDLSREIAAADWIITGEGSFDQQSLCGKVVGGITAKANQLKKKVCVIAGRVALPEKVYRRQGVEIAIACAGSEISDLDAVAQARPRLYKAAEKFIERGL